ncbi:cisplatin damage response ATP-dependent DNA ligase [Alteromonas sp.]|uniref:cisplatin damage response ATP-dependent DNA ligase n=1 Tax=Alteromonas sp. TaxID=232 RepID=UPI000B696F08|nr:cisplatin damage response ATP-dependent DNA ligase [Alteromonas sp.]MAI37995.1 ATP-dependent DNA ligase [Alteromonas sp.]OUX86882.1 MAG: ATP-dependent DNA ligase [Alteromonas sp. TMED35]|tara:strand:- start:17926 stop:19617 length:1692 start_codon:yes stop_codon:yes gene_type:complete
MEAFSNLLEQLYFTAGTKAKAQLIADYIENTPDPDRGWAIAAMAGTLRFDFFKRNTVKKLITEHTDPALFAMSYDYVGEVSETVAHLWPFNSPVSPLPSLHSIVDNFATVSKQKVSATLAEYLTMMTPSQRWALLKLGTRGLRIGVSARSIKQILADYGNKDIKEIETLWHAVNPPYTELLQWLEGKADKPDIENAVTFHPVMLSHPIESNDIDTFNANLWQIENKYDGIRVQLAVNTELAGKDREIEKLATNPPHEQEREKALFSRTGDDISHSFPDLLDEMSGNMVLDGELLVIHNTEEATTSASNMASSSSASEPIVDTFNALQQRLNKKKPTKPLMQSNPVGLIVYDALVLEGEKLTSLTLEARRKKLASWFEQKKPPRLFLSNTLHASSPESLRALHSTVCDNRSVEGLMIKRLDSTYVPGRPKGQWYKWKRDPLVVDAVIMYAQRGHGKRSSFYSDFTFGAWEGEQLLPIGKAYSGFTDEELKKLDNWVRRNAVGRFGPVREVKKELVFEVAFDAVHPSNRHKSGVALRFPRIHRIRWDKPANEADTLDALKQLIER